MARPNLDDYITVAERIAAFYGEHERGSIRTEIVYDDGKRVVIKAEVYRHAEDSAPATGHAEEIRGDGPVNKTSALENAETSAVGRAIAMLGFEVKKGVASREEVEQALAEEKRQATSAGAGKSTSDRMPTRATPAPAGTEEGRNPLGTEAHPQAAGGHSDNRPLGAWAEVLYERIKTLDVPADEVVMKLATFNVEKIRELTEAQAIEMNAWLDERKVSVAL